MTRGAWVLLGVLVAGCERPPTVAAPPAVAAVGGEYAPTRQVGVHIGGQVPFYYEGMDEKRQDATCTVTKYERNRYRNLYPEMDVEVTLQCKVKKP